MHHSMLARAERLGDQARRFQFSGMPLTVIYRQGMTFEALAHRQREDGCGIQAAGQ
jgi:hypothetical protein